MTTSIHSAIHLTFQLTGAGLPLGARLSSFASLFPANTLDSRANLSRRHTVLSTSEVGHSFSTHMPITIENQQNPESTNKDWLVEIHPVWVTAEQLKRVSRVRRSGRGQSRRGLLGPRSRKGATLVHLYYSLRRSPRINHCR